MFKDQEGLNVTGRWLIANQEKSPLASLPLNSHQQKGRNHYQNIVAIPLFLPKTRFGTYDNHPSR